MLIYKFTGLFDLDRWISPAYVQIGEEGEIINILNKIEHQDAHESVPIVEIEGFAIPGINNTHSHAFQYAMAGLTEHSSGTSNQNDNFWTWRETMYKIALSIQPDQMLDIATMLYKEMLKNGYTHVAEFHYLHHDPDGKRYENPALMAAHLIEAARIAGINITLVPIFYQKGGFGKQPSVNQRRFISISHQDYLLLFNEVNDLANQFSHANTAIGFHSLRAVEEKEIKSVLSSLPDYLPIHIHVSEQKKEVEESLHYLHQRPVEWLKNEIGLHAKFNLVHATHIDEEEILAITTSGAQVILCPTTEGNLGDGLFPFAEYKSRNGLWSIGTDSHIGINPWEELRLLDYGQRLIHHKRNTFHEPENTVVAGNYPIRHLVGTSRTSLGKNGNPFDSGQKFDAVIINAKHPLLVTTSHETLLNTIIYTGDTNIHLGTMVNGKWVIKNGLHAEEDSINSAFIKSMHTLNIR